MSEHEPARLMDAAADPVLRDALRVASRDAPTAAQIQALADQVAGTIAHGAVGAAAWKASWLKLSVLAVASLGGTALLLPSAPRVFTPRTRSAEVRAAPAVEVERARSQPALPSVAPLPQAGFVQPDAPALAAAPERSSDPPAHETPSRTSRRASAARHAESRRRPQAERAARPERAPELSELALIDRAQRAIASEPQRALALLAQHRELYPEGNFAEEREVLTLDALHHLRWDAQMRDKAREFLQRYPQSLHAARVGRLLIAR